MPAIRPETLNVIQLGVGFFFIFFAFNSQGFIEQPVISSVAKRGNVNEHAGYYSLSIIYAVFTVANFVAAPIVNILSAKWAMVLGGSMYCAFQAGFLHVNQTYLFISSAALGFGAAILWTGQGTYLSKNCDETTTSRNSAMLWSIMESCIVAGGIFLFIVFHQSKTTDDIPDSTVHLLYIVFTILNIVGLICLALLRTPPVRADEENKPKLSYPVLLGSTFRLMFTKKMLLLAFAFSYTGIEQSFWTGVYPTCISYTLKLGDNTNSMLALTAMCEGLGHIMAGGAFGILATKTKKLGRDSIVLCGTIVQLICFAGVYINIPADAPIRQTNDTGGLIDPQLWIALVCGFLLAFGDACWNTQIYSLLVDVYSQKSSQAFALFKFYQSGLSCAAFFYGSKLQLQWHLAILVLTALIATLAFFMVERLNSSEERSRESTQATDTFELPKSVDAPQVPAKQTVDDSWN
ncbi:unnamed protein product, partial [Mesorhabditis belari]|uniref:UNC93-like protein MFSD11 n=1 Tax=Mesorhabditis belari TaxID=2138241 RepID=A0AAF3FIM2_9BILA